MEALGAGRQPSGDLLAQEALRSSRSAIHTLMIDWRVTPSRFASRSRDSTILDGKSTLTRRNSNEAPPQTDET